MGLLRFEQPRDVISHASLVALGQENDSLARPSKFRTLSPKPLKIQWLRHDSQKIRTFVLYGFKNRPLDLNQDAKLGVPQ